jgi:hypothetical protein
LLKEPTQLDERVPVEVGAIQVNFCKNPQCQNFGVPASTKRQPRGKGAAERGRDTYSVVGSGRGTPMLRCSLCGQYPTIKRDSVFSYEANVEACVQSLHSLGDILAQIINVVILKSHFGKGLKGHPMLFLSRGKMKNV